MNNEKPNPDFEDTPEVRAALLRWLHARGDEFAGVTIASMEVPGETGMSNITVLLDLQTPAGALRQYVLRIAPQAASLFRDYDLASQYQIMAALAQQGGVPVPRLAGLEIDAAVLGSPFYLMARVPGRIPPDIPPYHLDGWITALAPEERSRMWWHGVDAICALHRVPLAELQPRLATLRAPLLKGLDQQLAFWRDYYQWGYQGARSPACERAFDWLAANTPSGGNPDALCWGDARMANVIFAPDLSRVDALLDWEMAVIGDPLLDICWWIYMDYLLSEVIGFPRLEGMPTAEETLAYWADRTGLSTANSHFYSVYCGLRIALILGRTSVVKGDNSMVEDCFATQHLDRLMA